MYQVEDDESRGERVGEDGEGNGVGGRVGWGGDDENQAEKGGDNSESDDGDSWGFLC